MISAPWAIPLRRVTRFALSRRASVAGAGRFTLVPSQVASGLVFLTLVGMAAIVRWPQLQMIPPYTDETEESLRAWGIYIGTMRPLVNDEPYIGALWNYVVAGLFFLFGPDPEVPRLASMFAGALTVGMTYLLGRRLYGNVAGVVAAVLLAANGAHILVNSHVAWSNCVTPLFTTVGFWLLLRALDRPNSVARLGAAGIVWGLALQTHPTVVVLMAGAAIYALLRDPRLPRRPAAWVAALMLLVGYGNVLVHNLQTGFSTFEGAQQVGAAYGGPGLNAERYLASLLGCLLLTVKIVASVVDARPTAEAYIYDARILAGMGVLLAAVAWAVWRRQWLLLLVGLPMLLVVAALNQRWQPILASRYIMPLAPLVFVVIGGLAADLLARMPWRPLVAWGMTLTVVGAVALIHVLDLRAYYRDEIAATRTNNGPWQMIQFIREQRRAREALLVPAEIRRLPSGGGGSWGRALNYLATVRNIPGTIARFDPHRPIRACDVTSVELRYEPRVQAADPPPGAPRHEGYWLVQARPLVGEIQEEQGTVMLVSPYTLPWQQRSLFDPEVPTFETGCPP